MPLPCGAAIGHEAIAPRAVLTLDGAVSSQLNEVTELFYKRHPRKFEDAWPKEGGESPAWR